MTSETTESKYREQLRQAESRFRMVFEKLPVGLLVLNPDGSIVFSNSKTTRMLNFEPSFLRGKDICHFFQAKGFETFAAIRDHLERNSSCELIATKESGEPIPVELTLSDFEINGNPAFLASFADISERKRFEKLKDELIAMVSHDLSTPLSSIQLTLNLLSAQPSGVLNEKLVSQVQRAERSTGQLIKLINDLLTVERLESGRIDMFPEEMSVAKLLQDSVELVLDRAEQHQLQITTVVEDIRIIADKDRLQQVVVNFLSNAIKFSPPNGKIQIGSKINNKEIEVFVQDQGRGVPEKDQQRIFERFQQVELADAREKGGKGLGLAISKAIVQAHGGTIGVTSTSGSGSAFWFTIPVETSTAGQ